jgi:hypothetical protein
VKDFELIVYIIAALIYFVSKNYRKVQRNRPGQPASEPASEPVKPAQVPRKRKKEVLAVPAQQPLSSKVPYQAMKRQSLAKEYKPVRRSTDSEFLKSEIESTQKFFQNLTGTEEQAQIVQISEAEDIKPYLMPDDLKKAIIYAEIIRRPYN